MKSSEQGCQKDFKQQADNEQWAALELAPKVKVLEGRGIQGHFEFSLGNGVSRGFQEVFPLRTSCCFVRIHARLGTMPSKCLRRFPRHRTVRTVSQIKTCLNIHSVSFKTGKRMLYNFIQFAVLIGDESSRLRMANQPAGFVSLPALIDSAERVKLLLRCPQDVNVLEKKYFLAPQLQNCWLEVEIDALL